MRLPENKIKANNTANIQYANVAVPQDDVHIE